jgi:hypothetical protein
VIEGATIEGEGGGAGEPSGAADSVCVVGDIGDDPLQAVIDTPVTSTKVATRQPDARSHLLLTTVERWRIAGSKEGALVYQPRNPAA